MENGGAASSESFHCCESVGLGGADCLLVARRGAISTSKRNYWPGDMKSKDASDLTGGDSPQYRMTYRDVHRRRAGEGLFNKCEVIHSLKDK